MNWILTTRCDLDPPDNPANLGDDNKKDTPSPSPRTFRPSTTPLPHGLPPLLRRGTRSEADGARAGTEDEVIVRAEGALVRRRGPVQRLGNPEEDASVSVEDGGDAVQARPALATALDRTGDALNDHLLYAAVVQAWDHGGAVRRGPGAVVDGRLGRRGHVGRGRG